MDWMIPCFVKMLAEHWLCGINFGKNNPFGWVIDHILPMSLGGDDNLLNLRALHYKNNLGKADDYPSYTASVKYDGRENAIDERNLTVNKKLREKLKQHYKNSWICWNALDKNECWIFDLLETTSFILYKCLKFISSFSTLWFLSNYHYFATFVPEQP